jgi:hypothetical protein
VRTDRNRMGVRGRGRGSVHFCACAYWRTKVESGPDMVPIFLENNGVEAEVRGRARVGGWVGGTAGRRPSAVSGALQPAAAEAAGALLCCLRGCRGGDGSVVLLAWLTPRAQEGSN